ncbi:DUF2586 domain-containing protein [Shewanella sp. GutDb-MelDb]|uniref:DUF2586 domain-containing protein n=1 Tax=Shewanella sp. GutDb-MelDb TaxID=2058316 RepID=UPI000C7BA94F|nr:DUF2586 domain-containing protein [Shewanella sp. GutDb-MelDb]PKG57733.1 DUF2586 domain-containing protein [Shewanella sp. GutDb-MelDb]
MPLGNVTVNNQNQAQGEVQAIERHFLFIGLAGKSDEASQLFSLNAQSDIESMFVDSNLRKQLIAAQLNAGQNWTAGAYPLAVDETIATAIGHANEVQSFETVVVCDVQKTAQTISGISDAVLALQGSHGRWCSVIVALPGIGADETWPQYEAKLTALVAGLALPLVVPVPQLNGNNVGVLAGRLCNRSVSIADSPMRVATGSVAGLGVMPTDSEETPLSLASLSTLAKARLSVPQWYPDVAGVYWGDGSTLEVEGGDFQVIENLRVVHKASREVRVRAILRVANRILNSTPASIELNKAYFIKPLRMMSKTTTVNGVPFPGDITPPRDGDIAIVWISKTKVTIAMVVRPYNSPKSITVNIMLDLSVL